MLTCSFQLYGFGTVPLPEGVVKQGPFSKRRPAVMLLAPGPPFNQSIRGAVSGACLASKNLEDQASDTGTLGSLNYIPEKQVTRLGYVEISRVLSDCAVAQVWFRDAQAMAGEERVCDFSEAC